MSSGASGLRLELVGAPDSDTEELDGLTAQLRNDLLELDVEDVRRAPAVGGLPDGAKAGTTVAVGALVVTAAPFLVRQVLHLVDTWLQNRPDTTVRVELDGGSIELGHASAEERRRLIDLFVDEAGRRSGSGPTGE
ncbi:hypothetical protein [Streptomyces sp. SBT349]|uniref:hypothetical protein n=1 Tax=Streptomyces sp. SBT349 TaxID=1580539 RepID=UPI00066CB641|nr:hypothetical protein [Streptomyces sp. SBT349]